MLHVSKYPNGDKGLQTTVNDKIVILSFSGKQDHLVYVKFLTAADAVAFYNEIKDIQLFRKLTLVPVNKRGYSYLLVIDSVSEENKFKTFFTMFTEEVVIDLISKLPETRQMNKKLLNKAIRNTSDQHCMIEQYNTLLYFKYPDEHIARGIIRVHTSPDEYSEEVLNYLNEKNIGQISTLTNTYVNDICKN